MKRTIYFLAACAFSSMAWMSPASAQCPTGPVTLRNMYLKAQDLKGHSETSLSSYSFGFLNGLFVSPIAGGSQECLDKLFACVEGRNSLQLAAILRKYLADHPEEWHLGASTVTFNAFLSPCAKG